MNRVTLDYYTPQKINIVDLLRSILKKWKLVLFISMVSCAIFTVLSLVMPERVREGVEDDVVFSAIGSYDESIAVAEEAVVLLEEQILEQEEYVNNALLMQLDANRIEAVTMEYVVNVELVAAGEYSDAKTSQQPTFKATDVGSICNTYVAYVNNGVVLGLIADKMGIDENYLREIITAKNTNNIFSVTVYHHDGQSAKDIAEVLKEIFSDYQGQLWETMGMFELVLIGESGYVTSDAAILNTQNANVTNYRNALNAVSDAHRKVSEQIQAKENYVNNLVATQEQSEQLGAPSVSIIKLAGLGLLVGILLACVIVVVQYVFNNKLKYEGELSQRYGLKELGAYHPERSCFTPEEDIIAAKIKIMLKEGSDQEIFINCLFDENRNNDILEKMDIRLKARGIWCRIENLAAQNAEALEAMALNGKTLLICEAAVTTYGQVEEMLTLGEEYDIDIIGCLFLNKE